MEKNWILRSQGEEQQIRRLVSELGIDYPLANLLIQRGLMTPDMVSSFFLPDLKNLPDPFLMKDMELAVTRIETAVKSGETILIYGDYDVDGKTSVAMIYSFLKKYHDKLDFYIPDRYSEGYGISYTGIDYAGSKGCSLLIALDCGIKAIDKVRYAKSKGIGFIICDHHTPGAGIPEATAVLDPKRPDCN